MNQRVISLTFILAFAFSAVSSAATFVVPGGSTSTPGNSDLGFPFDTSEFGITSQRYQQIYSATEFSLLTVGGEFITAIAFRPHHISGEAFSTTLPDIQISLSTTTAPVDGLSATFANNVGANATVVVPRGSLTLSSAFTGPSGGPKAFDIIITLATPFFYNRAAGNLLLDVQNFGGGVTTTFDAVFTSGDAVSRIDNITGDANSPTADQIDTRGLVTRFTTSTVPEPSSALLLLAGAFCFARRSRSRV